MKLVIVESPAKARSLEGYLGDGFWVRASYGHVRDLKDGSGSVNPDEDFALTWDITPQGKKHLNEIMELAKKADTVFLATDPDREGEAIAWHVAELLKASGVTCPLERIAFNAITPQHVKDALQHPKPIAQQRVEAYLARLSLDYLVGYSLSPVLWKKLPGSKSGGRVQSVALRCIVERAEEREAFKPQEYWHVAAGLQKNTSQGIFQANVSQWRGEKLGKFSLTSADQAQACVDDGLLNTTACVTHLQEKELRRNPYPPFTTSTLQQEASQRYGFAPARTMRIAQKLYEGISLSGGEHVGLITYMRTDSLHIITEVVLEMRQLIPQLWGDAYLAPSVRHFKQKAKNAQEAHEAIRPTALNRTPESVRTLLSDEEFRLYDLIWRRTLASQMAASISKSTHVDLMCTPTYGLTATGTVRVFDGFLKVHGVSEDDEEALLPLLTVGDVVKITSLEAHQHFTQPPPRYTDASLIKTMESLGIGRPSTYAHILHILKEREYIAYKGKSLLPQERGRMVVAFLKRFFPKYVAYDFTAELEDHLDSVAKGDRAWKGLMRDFWQDFNPAIQSSHDVPIFEVLRGLNQDLGAFLFPEGDACPQCKTGKLGLRLWKTNLFIGCTTYPECRYTRPITTHSEESPTQNSARLTEPRLIGEDPHLKIPITLRSGPHGPYLQWGEGNEKRVGLPKGVDLAEVTLSQALTLGSFPRNLGLHPETQQEVSVTIGSYGPYIAYQKKFFSLPKGENWDPATLTLEEALGIMEAKARKAANATPRYQRTLGNKKPAKSSTKRPTRKKADQAHDKVSASKSPKARVKKESSPKSSPAKSSKSSLKS